MLKHSLHPGFRVPDAGRSIRMCLTGEFRTCRFFNLGLCGIQHQYKRVKAICVGLGLYRSVLHSHHICGVSAQYVSAFPRRMGAFIAAC